MKTQLFSILSIGWDIRNQQIFHSKIIKKHACNPNMCFVASNDRTYQKVIQNGLQRGTQNLSKIIKIHPGTFQGPSECICDPLDCKMVPKWCPRTSKWSQNGHLRTLKGNENQQNPITNYVTKSLYLEQCSIDFNPGNLSNPANPSSVQITS